MQVLIFDDKKAVAENAATLLQKLILAKNNANIGLATGSTPIDLYKQLVSMYKNKHISFAQVNTFNLDEYYDIDENNSNSYRYFMNSQLFDHIDIDKNNTHLPTCNAKQDPRKQGEHFEQQIAALGGLDLQLLGIGGNGHIGFNEPSSSFASRTRIKSLTEQTVSDNSRMFSDDEQQPKMAMTMGIATIMDAKYVLLIATGKNKAQAVNDMVNGPLSASCPASILQMHKNAIVIIDNDAASLLANKDYFTWVSQQNHEINQAFGHFPDL
ncbi:glucosamine-6-phosphate deaminase (plasmid) [Pseudoalteromonas sp. HL-AS2]|uniref:Glucosamine-6-phosphate deaminase n=1 Tax=Pseudoalteromonas translucida (strain TAC 125) TaxID=326442 RepID=NAGB_PSET1|nr:MULTISPECIES: glucosamine-6-phosphate deaminase [Pseudoalteromonas]Q3ID09.1 RecName: Full=Glucosamine-6-phosphate deaminase; AltName: Full=GlcN6P deaminase; Short=GNPDA; AltName: Full=Glucosamine-6-phosphate isomerase [Pseudoalteromonas translucida TAC125]MBH0092221.1 glucosamine-6-phosphate deaminase [Pseudoalteromonas sp. SCQQ13]WMS96173.1 glucosamine-6-phosphate deaminase [Pseudoalteromonas sp. HL-AS2]CAI89195.1 putative glucosamine-6-phosphate deaminase [Pseudoalteromonas translucida]